MDNTHVLIQLKYRKNTSETSQNVISSMKTDYTTQLMLKQS